MAINKPVPSRAAINALRGIVFTTSCSVILLAEERRRRTKIARSAIDNARRLHTVQTRRRSTALQEVRFTELDDDVRAALPTILGKRKRKTRLQNVTPSESHVNTDTDAHNLPSSPPNASRLIPSINHDLISGALKALDLNSTNSQRKFNHAKTFRVAQQPSLSFAQQLPINRHRAVDHFHALSEYRLQETEPKMTVKEPRHQLEHTLSVARKLGTSGSAALDETRIFHSILDEINERPHPPLGVQEALEAAVNILESDEYQKRTHESAMIDFDYSRLLHTVIVSEAPNSRSILERVFRARQASISFIHDAVTWLAERQHMQQLSMALGVIIQNGTTDQAPEVCTVLDIIKVRKQGTGSYLAMLGLYHHLVQAGLFDLAELRNDEKYDISKYVATEAMGAGDYINAQRQWDSMITFDAQRTAFHAYDFCSRIVPHKATSYTQPEVQLVAKEKLFSLLCEATLQNRNPGALERVIRKLVAGQSWKVDQAWICPIMDFHRSRNDEGAVFSWLAFALSNHKSLDDRALSMIIAHYRQHCKTTTIEADIENLFKQLHAAGVVLPEGCDPAAREKRGLTDVVSRPDNAGSFHKIPKEGDSARQVANEERTFASIKRLSRSRNWSQAVALYWQYEDKKGEFSLRCLKEVVEAQLRIGPDGWKGARQMLERAHKQGHNVNEVAERILSRRLHDGADPEELVAEATAWGLRISDTMYNAAFKSLSRQGDMEKAKSICMVAAENLAAGDLVFSDWNFSNLLFALVGLGPRHYGEIESLLAEFLSVDRTWQGNKTCKEAIKLAMKTVAARAVTDGRLAKRHEKALHNLAEALVHCRHVRAKCSAARRRHNDTTDKQSTDEESSYGCQEGPLSKERIHGELKPSSVANVEFRHSDASSQPLFAAVGAG